MIRHFQVLSFVFFIGSCALADDTINHVKTFRIEAPSVALKDVPLQRVLIVAIGANGAVNKSFSSPVEISGLKLIEGGRETRFPSLRDGKLELITNRSDDRTLFATSPVIKVELPDSAVAAQHVIRILPGWVSLVPPLLAILLAIVCKEVMTSLLLGTLAGMVLLSTDPLAGAIKTVDPLILSTLASSGNAQIILFTMMLGAMIGILSGSGGSLALVECIARRVKTSQQGQLTTWLLGLVIFFDDYGNTLLVGSTMRPVADRLKISREKLAYLVDSTAAPVAGLALISTWVGVEIGYMQSAYESMGLPTEEIYQTFIATIPYRFYPILTLIFVGQLAWSGRDYGPMLLAERRRHESVDASISEQGRQKSPEATLVRHAVIPLVVLCLTLAVALNVDFEASSRALVLASFAAVVAGVLSVVLSGTASLIRVMEMAITGMQQMLPAVIVLILAWSIGTVCDADHLNTAGYLVNSLADDLSARWLPLVTFLLAAGVSFATGTSYGTMGLLIPLSVGIEYELLQQMHVESIEIASHPLMLATVGSVLGGAIFGDHCSPISDTTVLSSAATGCEHLKHVKTQMPYAVTVGLVSVVICYLPLAYGLNPWAVLLLAVLIQWGIIRIIGKS